MNMHREELIAQVLETMNIAKRTIHSRMHLFLQGLPVSFSQAELLSTVRELQPISATVVAKKLSLTPGAISQSVDTLVGLDLIRRSTSVLDRRLQLLEVTKPGMKLLHDIEQRRREVMKHVMDGMTTEELQLLLGMQEKIIRALQDTPANQTEPKRKKT
jgi:DNA-binding MarR family transcriptional regulator